MPHLRSSYLAFALLSLPLFAACGYGDHPRHHYDDGSYQNPGSSGTIEEATIDVDQLLDVEPGVGAGVFIEYESGGTYHVSTSCDVRPGVACLWDVVVTTLDGASVKGVTPVDLETDDYVSLGATNQVRLVAYTGNDFDGFSFETEPGAAIEVDALLDDSAANKFMFWVGDGAVHSGAPSNPVDLVPSGK
jgi:hypothetical protein